ncbi:MAG: HDOD domain-containing protein [Treponema sp.]|nr:HDOD domain-containing protein [Treponema sp.]
MVDDSKKAIDKEKIKSSIRLWLPISITTYTLPHSMEMYMQDVLTTFLSECHQEHMSIYLSYCLSELVTNAKKANTKWIYFKEKGLDINNEEDYETGMKTFKKDTLENIDYWLLTQKKEGLFVRLVLQEYKDKIKIEIHNNRELTVFEYKRIHDKLARARKYTSVDEVMSKILDPSEGAGLGIVIIILMLEKIGLTEENYQVISENGETITRIILPVNKESDTALKELSESFAENLEKIPVFQSKLNEIDTLLNDPAVTVPALSKKISKDISLSLIALQHVNSEMGIPCTSLPKAIETIGIEKLRTLYNQKNSMLRFISPLDDEGDLWEHSSRIAFYSYNLARNLASEDSVISEEIFIKGLLHDLGRVMYSTAAPEQMDHLTDVLKANNYPFTTLNSLAAGINHGHMGYCIAKKWGFPDDLCGSILYHHDPLYAPRSFSKSVAIVYIADMMSRYIEKSVDFYQIDKSILRQFNIITEEKFSKLANMAEEAFLKTR